MQTQPALQPNIRKANLSDAKNIHTAHMQSIQQNCSKDYTEEQINAWGRRPYREGWMVNQIKNDYVWVVECNGIIEGYGHFHVHEKKTAEVCGLYLTKKVKGKGFGRQIMSLMKIKAKELGIKKLILSSTRTAKNFYEAAGFKQIGPDDLTTINGVGIEGHPMEFIF